MIARLELVDYRRRVAAIYAAVRDETTDPEARWRRFVSERDRLFRDHPQSALDPERRASFAGLNYFPYHPGYRVQAEVDTEVEHTAFEVSLRDDGRFVMTRLARLRFELPAGEQQLSLFWIEGYGGGIFLPFRDATNGSESYGGGRYLLDTAKHADLGGAGDRLLLDFNFAYHPSCCYSPSWDCPLAPPENRLTVPVPVGERLQGRAVDGSQVAAPVR